jgi:membrane protein
LASLREKANAGIFRRTFANVVDHDCLNLAQAAAYSALVSLFPGLIVAAAIVTTLPDSAPVRTQVALFFDRILPADVSPMLDSYFTSSHAALHSTRALVVAAIVSLTGASSVIVTLMEGFRRAYHVSAYVWTFWGRRWRSFALVFIALVPFGVASVLVVFGHLVSLWIAANIGPSAVSAVLVVAFLVRWTVALSTSVAVIAIVYHMAIPAAGLGLAEDAARPRDRLWGSVRTVRAISTMENSWKRTLPGAVLATVMWLVTTLVFGLYVTRFANYSEVYGSLGAGVALLFWLYIISLSILAGAEFNAQLYPAYCGEAEPGAEPVIAEVAAQGTARVTAQVTGQVPGQVQGQVAARVPAQGPLPG